MIYYGIAAIFPLVMWFFYSYLTKGDQFSDRQRIRWRNFLAVIAILPMFLLFVLRYKTIGSDTIGYVRFFENGVRNYTLAELLNIDLMRQEVAYRIYVKLISLITTDYTVYFLINGIVIFGTLLHFAKKYTENPFVFFFLFMTLGTYQFMETGLRQSLAIVICLWSIDFLKDKKIIRFILLVILASLFHQSAWVFLLMLPLSWIRKTDWTVVSHVIIAAAFVTGFTVFHELFNEWLGYEYNIEETGNGVIFLALVFILFAFSLFMTYAESSKIEGQSLIIHLAILTVTLWVLRLISRTAERISYYYIIGLYAYFAQAVNCRKDKLSDLAKGVLIVVCLALFIYRNLDTNYLFFWGGL